MRRAEARDVPAIVDLLAADQLGATRDGVRTAEDLVAYQQAFHAIDSDSARMIPTVPRSVVGNSANSAITMVLTSAENAAPARTWWSVRAFSPVRYPRWAVHQ
jgi:hypothetical protein